MGQGEEASPVVMVDVPFLDLRSDGHGKQKRGQIGVSGGLGRCEGLVRGQKKGQRGNEREKCVTLSVHTEVQTNSHKHSQTDRQTDGRTDEQTDKWSERGDERNALIRTHTDTLHPTPSPLISITIAKSVGRTGGTARIARRTCAGCPSSAL